MNGLTVTQTVQVNITADEWDLYTYSYGAACDQAARQLNIAIEEAVNAGKNRNATMDAVWPVFMEHSQVGATDSEPMFKLEKVMDEIFGRKQ